jgi:hypothetical protein
MKATSRGLLVLSVFSVIPITNASAQLAQQLPVKSYALQDVRAFNAQLAAREPSDAWQNQPLGIALEYLNGASDGRMTSITSQLPEGEDPESPSTVVITVVQDGFLDDSVRGQWHRLTLKKNKKERWMLLEARSANLCQRGSNTQAFQKEPCP